MLESEIFKRMMVFFKEGLYWTAESNGKTSKYRG